MQSHLTTLAYVQARGPVGTEQFSGTILTIILLIDLLDRDIQGLGGLYKLLFYVQVNILQSDSKQTQLLPSLTL